METGGKRSNDGDWSEGVLLEDATDRRNENDAGAGNIF